jgi:hypothetical protein
VARFETTPANKRAADEKKPWADKKTLVEDYPTTIRGGRKGKYDVATSTVEMVSD